MAIIIGPLQALSCIVFFYKMIPLLKDNRDTTGVGSKKKLDNYLIVTLSLIALSILCMLVMLIIEFVDTDKDLVELSIRLRTAQ